MGGWQLPGILAARKLGYFGHVMRKPGNSMEKDLITGTTARTRRRVRSDTVWISDIDGLVGDDSGDVAICSGQGVKLSMLPKSASANKVLTMMTLFKLHPSSIADG